VKIVKVTDTDVHLDTNHELAGKALIFDITIEEIK
jgi:FKBP-type peptidyl-prolyl cis-trans isomerase 2